METAIAHQLSRGASQKLAPKAWVHLRTTIQNLIVAQKDIWIVLALSGPRHSAVAGAAAAARHASRLEECRVLDMAPVVKDARDRYRELIEAALAQQATTGSGATIRRLHSKGA